MKLKSLSRIVCATLLPSMLLGANSAEAAKKGVNKSAPALVINNRRVNESAGYVQLPVRLLRKSNKPVTVRYASKPRSGKPGKDYRGVSGKLTFRPGQTWKSIRIKLIDDNVHESTEHFVVKIFAAKNAKIKKGQALVAIRDNDKVTAKGRKAVKKPKPVKTTISRAPRSLAQKARQEPKNVPSKKAPVVRVVPKQPPVTSVAKKPPVATPVAPENIRPSIDLVSPSDNTNYVAQTSIQLEATSADRDGKVVKVEFYNNGSLLGADATRPFSFSWTNATVGSHDIKAVAVDNEGLSQESTTHRIIVAESAPVTGSGNLVVYPATQEIQNKFRSDRFSVEVSQNGVKRNSFVYKSENDANPGWSGTLDYMQKANHWTTFSFGGSVNVKAKRLDGKTIQTCVVRPQSLNIKPVVTGNTCSFNLNKAAKVSVEIDEKVTISESMPNVGKITKQIVKHPLFVFADPLEKNIPTQATEGVLYFGPGMHRIGKQHKLSNDTQVYIAGGAFVIGTFKSAQSNPKNITIRGRGILSGTGVSETKQEHGQWGNHAIDYTNGRGGSNLLIEGITIADPLRSCIVSYNSVNIRNVKLMSWSHRNDGITAGANSIIEDSFIKVTDDNIKLYYSNQTVRRNVVWQQTAGAVFKLAWQLNGVSQGHNVHDIDIIHSDVFNDYQRSEKDRPEMRSTNAIFSSMGFRKGAAFKGASFKDIRIEEKNLYKLMGLRMVTTHLNKFWGDPSLSASKQIEGITFENISIAGVPHKQSTLYGNKGGRISNIRFKGLKINGTKITSSSMMSSRNDGNGLITLGNVDNVTFSP